MKNTRAVIFDLDGTLLDVRDCFYWQFQELSWHYDKRIVSEQEINAIAHGTTEQIVRRLVANTGIPLEEIMLKHQELRLLAYDQHLRLYDGAIELLSELSAEGIKIAALTAGNFLTVHCLDRTQIRHHFQLIITADHVTRYKPHPEGLLRIMQDLAVEPSQTVMVGDTVADILTGKAAGVRKTFGVLHGFGSAADLSQAGADSLVTELASIPGLLD
jgi:pyrophosphatase PpaX